MPSRVGAGEPFTVTTYMAKVKFGIRFFGQFCYLPHGKNIGVLCITIKSLVYTKSKENKHLKVLIHLRKTIKD